MLVCSSAQIVNVPVCAWVELCRITNKKQQHTNSLELEAVYQHDHVSL